MKYKFPTCPACGFLTLDDITDSCYGSYNICNVCGWEDDLLQLKNPEMKGGANERSLLEAQSIALDKYPIEIKKTKSYKRDPDWRPFIY